MNEDIDQKLLTRFEIIQKIKKTSSGVIWKAIDRKTNSLVAIKKLNPSSQPIHLLKTIRETLILQELPKHGSILKVYQVINKITETYILYQYVELDLLSMIKAKILEVEHIATITFNLLCALYYLHEGGLVHLGLRPSKILVNSKCEVTLTGFGFSQMIPVQNPKYTNLAYVAPEILLQGKVTPAADIWSVGCIFGEMLCGTPLFTGTTALSQLEKILELLGPQEMRQNPIGENILKAIQVEKKRSLAQIVINSNKEQMDVLQRMLHFDPNQRIKIQDLIQMPFFKALEKHKLDQKEGLGTEEQSQIRLSAYLQKPEQQFTGLEEMNLRGYQELLKERNRKGEIGMSQSQFHFKRVSYKELTSPAIREKRMSKHKLSPIQSPNRQTDHLRRKGTVVKGQT